MSPCLRLYDRDTVLKTMLSTWLLLLILFECPVFPQANTRVNVLADAVQELATFIDYIQNTRPPIEDVEKLSVNPLPSSSPDKGSEGKAKLQAQYVCSLKTNDGEATVQ